MKTLGLNLQMGDVFCVGTSKAPGFFIRLMSWLSSKDNKVRHNHSGIILGPDGRTFEAFFTGIKEGHISKYRGEVLLIARPIGPSPDVIFDALNKIQLKHTGQVYPFLRILLFCIPYAAKFVSSGKWYVCSEITASYLRRIGLWFRLIGGTTPDDITDYIWEQKGTRFEIIFDRRIRDEHCTKDSNAGYNSGLGYPHENYGYLLR